MVPVNAAYFAELVVRSPVVEVVVGPNSIVAEVAAIGFAERPIVAAEAAAIAAGAVRTALAAGTGRLNTATASTVLADYSPVAAAANNSVVVVGPDSLAGAVTALPDVEPEAPSPWLCPLQIACQKKTWLDTDVVECGMIEMT